MKNKEKTIKYLENIKKRAEKMVKKEHIYYCKVCKEPVAKQVLAKDGTLPFEDIKEHQILGFGEFLCINCDE